MRALLPVSRGCKDSYYFCYRVLNKQPYLFANRSSQPTTDSNDDTIVYENGHEQICNFHGMERIDHHGFCHVGCQKVLAIKEGGFKIWVLALNHLLVLGVEQTSIVDYDCQVLHFGNDFGSQRDHIFMLGEIECETFNV